MYYCYNVLYIKHFAIKMDNPSNEHELEYNQDLNKENATSKSVISKRKRQKVLQELQISENLKEQADELGVGYKFESWEHVDQVLYAYAKMKGFVWRLHYRVDRNISKKVFECRHAGKPKPHKGNNPDMARITTSIRV